MKARSVLIRVFFLILSSLAASAFADGAEYVGVDLGSASYSGLRDITGPFGRYYHTVDTPFVGSSTDHDTAFRLTGGYQFDPYFGLETGYQDLGQVEIKGSVTYPALIPSPTPVDNKVHAHGFIAEAVGRWPIADDWALYGRAGGFFDVVDYEQGIPASSTSDRSIKFTYGVGVTWTVSEPIGVKLGWDRFGNLGAPYTTGQFSVDVLALGLVYTF